MYNSEGFMGLTIIGGKFRGRVLTTPPEKITRPTSQKLRGALFNILAPEIEESCFLDLAAGSGAIGFEALSRGAAQVFFVERNREAIAAICANQKKLAVEDCSTIITQDLRELSCLPQKVDFVYFDPPYELFSQGQEEEILEALVSKGILNNGAKLFWEHSKRRSFKGIGACLLHYKTRLYGEAVLEEFHFQDSCNS